MWASSTPVYLLVSLAALGAASKSIGPFDIDLQEVTKCDEEGSKDIKFDNFLVKMSGRRTVTVSVDVTSNVVIDNNITMNAEVVSLNKGGQYGSKPFKYPVGPVCEAMETFFPKSYQKLYKSVGVNGCPVQPNTFKLKNFAMEMVLPVQQLPYKQLRIDNALYREEKRLACIRILLALVPEGSIKF